MGLDITALRRAELRHGVDDDLADEGLAFIYINSDFSDRADGLTDGWYASTGSMDFRAGSYIGYNNWRERLSLAFVGVTPSAVWCSPENWCGCPFFELIHFSDCEGAIGPQTSAELARDFAEHAAMARELDSLRGDTYGLFRRAFEMAADDGVVQFK